MTSAKGANYDLLVKIASGGMGTVHLAAPAGRHELVALKRPHEHLLEDPSFRARLLGEAALASRVQHENVVGVRDVVNDGDRIDLVMEYVEGASLGQLLVRWARGGPRVPPGVAVRIVLDACAGLHAAHELCDPSGAPLGLIHRDVSPQNLLVALDGTTKVADFGLAKCMSEGDGSTTQGTLKGKLGYMSPEYIRGRKPDRRADVFALGVVLWEALVGRRLFRGESEPQTIDLVLREIPPRISSMVPDLGDALDGVVAQALEKQPDDRFPTAAALADALLAAAARERDRGLVADRGAVGAFVREAYGEELAARRAEAEAVRPSRVPRRRVAAGAALAGVVLLAGAAVALRPTRTAGADVPTISSAAAPAVSMTPPPPVSAAPAPVKPQDSLAPAAAEPTHPRPRAPAKTGTPRLPPPNPYTPGARTK